MKQLAYEWEEIRIRLKRIIPGDYQQQFCPTHQFDIFRDWHRVGIINFRIGQNRQILRYAGQIGYTIYEPFRGNRYATKALGALLLHGFQYFPTLYITCDPDHIASIKTIEAFPHHYHGIVRIPCSNRMFREGAREKRVYELLPEPGSE